MFILFCDDNAQSTSILYNILTMVLASRLRNVIGVSSTMLSQLSLRDDKLWILLLLLIRWWMTHVSSKRIWFFLKLSSKKQMILTIAHIKKLLRLRWISYVAEEVGYGMCIKRNGFCACQ